MGSGCYDATAFSEAVASAHSVFQVAKELGFNFDLLDIGGGFPGQWSDKITFKEVGSRQTTAALFYSIFHYHNWEMWLRLAVVET